MMNVEHRPEPPDPVAVRRTADTLIPLRKRGMDINIAVSHQIQSISG
jgi:hypothetical protein